METENFDFTEEMETVSQESGETENLDSSEEAGETVPEETEILEETEETPDESSEEYVTPDMLESLLAVYSETATADEELVTLWDKPISDYSTSEGLLLVVVILLLWMVISRQIGGVFK